MRKFILMICFLLACSGTALAQELRQTTDLANGWRFQYGEAGEAPAAPGFDDRAWEQVSVPHTWNKIGEYAEARSAGANNAQGVGWYRLTYDAPAAAQGKRFYLDFAAVGAIADVWVNGVHVGQHKGAFSRFRFDVTAQWKPGAANTIAVRADNSKPAVGSSTEHVIPLAGDFFIHGGIYRGVSLVTVSAFSFDLLDSGGPGLYISTPKVGADAAEVAARIQLRNADSKHHTGDVRLTIRDAAGAEVTKSQTRTSAGGWRPGLVDDGEMRLTIPNPRPWDGARDPYLYSLTAELIERGKVIDSVTQSFGVRNFRFDANEGFFLNGKHLPLRGVSRHQDRAGRGWALTRADHAEDMALIKEMGANTVRHAHYQHADEWSEEADKAGMIVWAEAPFVTTPSLTGGTGSPELWANAAQQLRELIRQNYNHPSIAMWSIGNEVDAAAGFGAAKEPVRPLALLQMLHKVAKEEDPSRPTTFADCCEGVGMMKTEGEMLSGTADLAGYNRYYGWYYPGPLEARAQLGKELDRLHAAHPALPISVSEYGAGGAISQHSDNVRSGFLNFMGRPQPEEYESFVHEENWPAIQSRKFVFASWVWNMFDFVSDLRKEGDSIDINTKGLVTFDRKTRKDAFYYYKAQWNPEPMIWLTGKRHTDRPYPLMDVRAYTNGERAQLRMNGAVVGAADCPDGVCVWPNVALRPGPNRADVSILGAMASGQGGASIPVQIEDSATFNGPDPAQGIRIDAGDLAGRVLGESRFGSDNFVTGGTPQVLNMGGFGKMQPVIRTAAAPQPRLYDYWREGEAFSYAVPVPDGRWQVTVHSFEPRASGTGAQAMTIAAQGRRVGKPFNIAKAAGGPLKGVTRTFSAVVKGGELKLDFAGTGGKAVVAAIEIAK